MNMAAVGGDTAISQWATPWHGLEALTDARNLLLGVAVFALSRVLALHFFLNYPDDPIETLAIASDPSPRECYPCGQCRQVMVDVERRQGRPMRIVMSGGGTASAVDTAEKLLPFTFKL